MPKNKGKRQLSTSEPISAKKVQVENEPALTTFGPRTLNEMLQPMLEATLKQYTSYYNRPGRTAPPNPENELKRIRQALISAQVLPSTSFYRDLIGADREDLHDQITSEWKNGLTFDLEAALVVNMVAHAILNPRVVAWDVTRLAEKLKKSKVKQPASDATVDQEPPSHSDQKHFVHLKEPTTIIDQGGRVMVWALPGVLHPNRLKDYHKATSNISDALKRGRAKQKGWRAIGFKDPEKNPPEFVPGIADFVPGRFMQGHTGMDEKLYISPELQGPQGNAFLTDIQHAETLLNCIGTLICPEQASLGFDAMANLKWNEAQHLVEPKSPSNIHLWLSFFSGIQVISNRSTPNHRDNGSAPADYDFLVSAGDHKNAWLVLEDIEAKLSYNPCTVVAISGRVLNHAMPIWEDGERLCIAHFTRDNVHERLKVARPDWVNKAGYLKFMDSGFLARQRW